MFLFTDDTNALSKGDDLPALMENVNLELQKLPYGYSRTN
jgi:hypothetical protein